MTTTINREEIQKFSDLADEWWDVNGKFKPLHMFNPIRIEYITEKIKQEFNLINQNNNFLKDLKIIFICSYSQIGQVVAALLATDCFMCTVVQNHQATSIILRLVLIPLIL